MKFELYTANKLKISNDKRSGTILNIAKYGITLAIVIMLLSLAIVQGFKNEIETKIYSFNPHIKLQLSPDYNKHITPPINYASLTDKLDQCDFIQNKYKVIEKQSLLKTSDAYKAINFRGYDETKDNESINSTLIDGCLPSFNGEKTNEIIVSKRISEDLNINTGDKVYAYFINDKVKVRKLTVTGIFNTDFQDYDENIVICNIKLLQQLNEWNSDECSYIGIECVNPVNCKDDSYSIYDLLIKDVINNQTSDNYLIYNIHDEYNTYFAWLDLLDTNILIILILMAFVSGFTLIAGMLIIIFDRIYTVGILKSVGASNDSIRRIFILLSQKLILKAMLYGNIIALIICFVQDRYHILKLNPDSYYMSFVPVEIDWYNIIILNIVVLIFSVITLILPSYIITKLAPNKILKFE